MRFLFVDLGSGWGGSERYLLWLMSALRARGHWTGCVAPRREFEAACDGLWLTGSRFANLGDARRLIEQVAVEERAQVVHYNADRAIHLAPFVRLPAGVARSATKHLTRPARKGMLDVRTPIENLLTHHSLRKLDLCICVSGSMLAELSGRAKKRAVLVENGVPDQRPAAFTPAGKQVVFLGRLSPEKGIDALLELARRCAARPATGRTWKLGIAGTGPLAADVERAADMLGADVLGYFGFEPDPSVVYSQAAALILPSSHEGMPLVVLEAFSWGLPVIAYDIPGVRDVLADGRNGFLVRRAEGIDGLERALDRLFDDPAERARLGAAARADYEARFRRESMIEKTVSLLERLAVSRIPEGGSETPALRRHR